MDYYFVYFVFGCFVFMVVEVCSSEFILTILHTNDVHARVEEFDRNGGTCETGSSKCYGGAARRYTAVEMIRSGGGNILLLDAGDQYQGTLWFNVYKGMAAVQFMNYTEYDAMALGNHEFDNGVDGLLPFLQHAAFHVLCSNMDVSNEPKWPKKDMLFTKSAVFVRSGRKIGVIGYITPDTSWLSQPGPNLLFSDVITSVRSEARRLQNEQGVDILIGLGHAGIHTDKLLATNVPELDVVIGGHSNTFLYTGTPPSSEKAEGEYPLVIRHSSGSTTLVVQDYSFGKYLGNLQVTFDSTGNVMRWKGNPILLDASYAQDAHVMKMVDSMDDHIEKIRKDPVGYSLVHLIGDRSVCRVTECNLGNLLTDAIVRMNQRNPDEKKWATIALGIYNGGGIRDSIIKNISQPITEGDLSQVLPFGGTVGICELYGRMLKQVFEHSVSGIERGEGRFLQVSGFRVIYNILKSVGDRLVQAKALCLNCTVPKYEPIKDDHMYKVAIPKYLTEGGDGYSMLKSVRCHPGSTSLLYLREYIQKEEKVSAALEERIVFTTGDNLCPPTSGAISVLHATRYPQLFIDVLISLVLLIKN